MPPPANEDLARLERRRKVAALYQDGKTQAEIAQELGIAQGTVSKDLAVVRGEWRASSIRDFDALREQELARVDELELTAQAAWERSREDAITEATTTGKTTRDGLPLADEVTRTVKGQAGDPRFLERVSWCVSERCRLLGLYQPTKVAPVDPTGTKEYGGGLSDDERVARIVALLEVARQRRDKPAAEADP